eukprot:Gb_00861 [translate_table: standard]
MAALAFSFRHNIDFDTQRSDNLSKRFLTRSCNLVQELKLNPSFRRNRNRNREAERWRPMALSANQSSVQEWPNPTTVEEMIQQKFRGTMKFRGKKRGTIRKIGSARKA